MSETIYRQLCEAMAQRGGRYPGKDIPEFYAMAQELFTPEEAEVCVAMPRKASSAGAIAQSMGRSEAEIGAILEGMANKGLCLSYVRDGNRNYAAAPFVPGIFEFVFMKGTSTDRDRKLAKLIHTYKEAFDKGNSQAPITFPASRVITVEQRISGESKVHTYDQVSSYIDQYEPIAVTTCYCRHSGKLFDAASDCGKPDDVCMQFGVMAEYIIERGMGRKVTREEARATLLRSEEAGLVHVSANTQEIDFICNCCSCHCMILKTALHQPKPGKALFSGFQPRFDKATCISCETCIERCPATALTLVDLLPQVNVDRCFGCGACSTACPVEAVKMVDRTEVLEPPINRKALAAAIGSASRQN